MLFDDDSNQQGSRKSQHVTFLKSPSTVCYRQIPISLSFRWGRKLPEPQNRLRPPIGVPRDRRNFIFVTAGRLNYCQFSEQSLNYKSIHAGREDVERSASALATIYDTSVSIGSRVPQFILW